MAQLVKNPPAMQKIPGSERSPGEAIGYLPQYSWAPLVYQTVKNLPIMQDTWVQSLDWEDPLGWEDAPGGGHGFLLFIFFFFLQI